jgi:hypothetical protein
VVRVAAVGGERLSAVWGPPLVVAHGRRVDVLRGPEDADAQPAGSLHTAQRVVALGASEGRAVVVTSDDPRRSTVLGIDLSDATRPTVLWAREGNAPPRQVVMSGEHVWLVEGPGRVALLHWPRHGDPARMDELAIDQGRTITALVAAGNHAVARAGPNVVLRAVPDGSIEILDEIATGRASIGGDWVAVAGSGLAVYNLGDRLPSGEIPSRSWTLPQHLPLRSAAIIGERLWAVVGRADAPYPDTRRLLTWSLADGRPIADVQGLWPIGPMVDLGGVVAIAGASYWTLLRDVDGQPHWWSGWQLPGRSFQDVLALAGGAVAFESGFGLVGLTPTGQWMPRACHLGWPNVKPDRLRATGSLVIGLTDDDWWILPGHWSPHCDRPRRVRPHGAEVCCSTIGVSVSDTRVAWWDRGNVSVAALEPPDSPDTRHQAGNLHWPVIESAILRGEQLHVLRRTSTASALDLIVYDTARPELPRWIASAPAILPAGVAVRWTDIEGRHLVALDSTSHLRSWDLSDPRRPRIIDSTELPAPAVDAALDGRCLWVASTGILPRLTLLELMPTGALREIASGPLAPGTTRVTAADGRAWALADGQVSVYMVQRGDRTEAAGAGADAGAPDCAEPKAAPWRRSDLGLPWMGTGH